MTALGFFLVNNAHHCGMGVVILPAGGTCQASLLPLAAASVVYDLWQWLKEKLLVPPRYPSLLVPVGAANAPPTSLR